MRPPAKSGCGNTSRLALQQPGAFISRRGHSRDPPVPPGDGPFRGDSNQFAAPLIIGASGPAAAQIFESLRHPARLFSE
jgi:hypothetical protein